MNYYENEITEKDWEEKLNELAPLIGWLVISFNTLENKINEILEYSFDDIEEEKAYIFFGDLFYSGKVKALMKYFRYIIRSNFTNDVNLNENLAKLESNLESVANKRNQYVHANWSEIDKENIVLVRKKIHRKIGLKEINVKITSEMISSDIDFIDQTLEDLEDFENSIS